MKDREAFLWGLVVGALTIGLLLWQAFMSICSMSH